MLNIKNDNIISLKIIDFGLSSKEIFSKYVNGKIGTPIYFAPEIVNDKNYSHVIIFYLKMNNNYLNFNMKYIDIWSAGIIYFMLFSIGIHPLIFTKNIKILKIEDINNNMSKNTDWKFPNHMPKFIFKY